MVTFLTISTSQWSWKHLSKASHMVSRCWFSPSIDTVQVHLLHVFKLSPTGMQVPSFLSPRQNAVVVKTHDIPHDHHNTGNTFFFTLSFYSYKNISTISRKKHHAKQKVFALSGAVTLQFQSCLHHSSYNESSIRVHHTSIWPQKCSHLSNLTGITASSNINIIMQLHVSFDSASSHTSPIPSMIKTQRQLLIVKIPNSRIKIYSTLHNM